MKAACSSRNRLPWAVCTILIMLSVSALASAASAGVGGGGGEVHVRGEEHVQLRRRATIVDAVVIDGNEKEDAEGHGVGVEEVAIPSLFTAAVVAVAPEITTSLPVPSHRILRTDDNNSISLEQADSIEQSYPKEYAITTPSSTSAHRRTQDIEDILTEMSTKDPSEWTAIEWFIMILFLSFLGWLGCCLLTICCCGGCDTSNLLGWLCCWEICCRGGSDIDRCCDYALA